MRVQSPVGFVSLLWELPLAGASFLFRRLMQVWVLAIGCGREYRANPAVFSHWQVNSRECLKTSLSLLRIMMVGPRWNTAAVCASAGPFRVERSMRIDIAALERSAGFWSMMVFRPTDLQRAASVNALQRRGHQGALELEVPPGDYFVNVRCYLCADEVTFPRIDVDGQSRIAPVPVSREVNGFHSERSRYGSFFYRALNYYVPVLVKWTGLFPARWVLRKLVPVGDPGTRFEFGILEAGEAPAFQLAPGLLDEHGVFFTAYDAASFPVQWYEVKDPGFVGPSCTERCVYLVRVVQLKPSNLSAHVPDAIRIQVVPAPPLEAIKELRP